MFVIKRSEMRSKNGAEDCRLHGSRSRRLLLVVAAVGLLGRLAVAIHSGLSIPPPRGSDASEYDSYAWNLAQNMDTAGSVLTCPRHTQAAKSIWTRGHRPFSKLGT